MWNDWENIAAIAALALCFLVLFAGLCVLRSALKQYVTDELRKLGRNDEEIARLMEQAEMEASQYNFRGF